MRMMARVALLSLAITIAPLDLGAQGSVARPRAERARSAEQQMNAFLESLRGEGDDHPTSFLPTEGEVTWVHTVHGPAGAVAGVWRFRGREMAAALEGCGPLRRSFFYNPESMPPGPLVASAHEHRGSWRPTGPNRFAPRGRSSFPLTRRSVPSAAFVEWRREGGRWVIASFGDESFAGPRLLGIERSDVVRQPPPAEPREPVYATGQTWFQHNEPFTFDGHMYVKFGNPRTFQPGALKQVGWRGRMRVYTDPRRPRLDILYVPVGSASYQSYVSNSVDECDSAR